MVSIFQLIKGFLKTEKPTSINAPHDPKSDLSHNFRNSDYEALGMEVPQDLLPKKTPSKQNSLKNALLNAPKKLYNAGKTMINVPTKLYKAAMGKNSKNNSR